MKFSPDWKAGDSSIIGPGDLVRVLAGASVGVGLGVRVDPNAADDNVQIAMFISEGDGAVSLRFQTTDDATSLLNLGPDWRVTLTDLFKPHLKRPPASKPRPLIVSADGKFGVFIASKPDGDESRIRMIDLQGFKVATVTATDGVEYFPWSLWLPVTDAGFGPSNPLIKVS